MTREVSLEQRQEAYDRAERLAMKTAVRWLNARTRGPVASEVEREMDAAQAELRRCRRRLEQTRERLAEHANQEAT